MEIKKLVITFFLVLVLALIAKSVFSVCGDVFPTGSPSLMDCGDGFVDFLDVDQAFLIATNIVTPTTCQLINGDVPNGIPQFCGNPAGEPNCETNGIIDIFDVLVISDKAMGITNCCDHCFADLDKDGILDDEDNCLNTPNGPFLGTCAKTISGVVMGTDMTCNSDDGCGNDESCNFNQQDYNNNTIGDVCECYGDFDQDGDCDGTDALIFKETFGRSSFYRPCPIP